MCQLKYRWAALVILLCLFSALWPVSSLAADGASIVEAASVSDRMIVYVRGAGEVTGVTAMLGRYTGRDITFQTVSEANVRVRTLFLIDNSLSIPESSRNAIREELMKIIAARRNNEFFAVGTIGEQTSVIQDFTNDYMLLREALESIVYQDQDAWLADTLYRLLSDPPFEMGENDYVRILLISDGMDENSDISRQYSRDELLALLRENPIPIYTLGIWNRNQSNDGQLENLSALSRTSGAVSFILDEVSESDSLLSALFSDWGNLVVKLTVPEDAQDGSLQTLTLTLKHGEDSRTLTLEHVRMPLSEKEVAEESGAEASALTTEDTEEEISVVIYILVGVLGTLLAVCLIVIIILLVKRRADHKRPNSAQPPKNIDRSLPAEEAPTVYDNKKKIYVDLDATVLENAAQEQGTVLTSDDASVCLITLTDIHEPARSFQKPIETSLVIGLARDSDIRIDYDPTVSRKHCEITKDGASFSIVNHSRSNGTRVNGVEVHGSSPVSDGDTIKMGNVEMRLGISQ